MFRFLGVPALIGRTILPEDAKPGAPPVFVLDYRVWHNRFNEDRSLLGRSFILNGSPMTLVGVMPRDLRNEGRIFGMRSLWDRAANKKSDLMFQARLKRGVSMAGGAGGYRASSRRGCQGIFQKIIRSIFRWKLNVD